MKFRISFASAVMAAALSWSWSAHAQAPSGMTMPKKIYTNRTSFKLPVRLEEKDRPRIQAVELHVRNGVTGAWTLQSSVPPTQNEFIYRATQDGEYWFTVVTVDKYGNRNPADLTQQPPSLVVVVDRQPPEVDVRPTTSPFGQALLQCEVRDAHPER